ncbi:hypothetical protein D9M71_636440 [compost metagenome]
MDLVSDFQADIRQVGQHLRQGCHDPLQRAQGTGQDLGRLLAHIRNAERIDKARQAGLLAGFDRCQQVVARQLGKPFKVDDLLEGQLVQVGR